MGELLGGGWIGDLPPAAAQAVRAAMREVRFEDGEVIFRQGDPGRYLYEIVSGQVNISHVHFDGSEQFVTVFGPGDCFGEQSLVDGMPRANSAQARGPVEVRGLGLPAFRALQRDWPCINQAQLKLISWRFRLALSTISEQASSTLRQRLLRRIYGLAQSSSRRVPGGVELTIRVYQSELAQWVGFSRQRVNMALMELQRDGIIRLSQGQIVILDMPALERGYNADHLLPATSSA